MLSRTAGKTVIDLVTVDEPMLAVTDALGFDATSGAVPENDAVVALESTVMLDGTFTPPVAERATEMPLKGALRSMRTVPLNCNPE